MSESDIGVVGLGTMGSALALNIADNGFGVAVWNRKAARVHEFVSEAGDLATNISPTETLEDLVAAIRAPRAIILMIPGGAFFYFIALMGYPRIDRDQWPGKRNGLSFARVETGNARAANRENNLDLPAAI